MNHAARRARDQGLALDFLSAATLLLHGGLLEAAEKSPSSAAAGRMFVPSPQDTTFRAGEVFGNRPLGGEQVDGCWPAAKPPFSFVYDGKASETFLHSWQRKTEGRRLADRVEYLTSWTDPRTGLKVSATTIAFKDFPAVDWVLRLENTGAEDSPMVEKVRALDILLRTSAEQPLVLDQSNGDDCSTRSFSAQRASVETGRKACAGACGRAVVKRHASAFQPAVRGRRFLYRHRLDRPMVGRAGPPIRRRHATGGRHGVDPFATAPGRSDPHAADHALALVRRAHRRP